MRAPPSLARRLVRCRRAASALEFALVAPFLCIGLLLLVDVGMGVVAKMELDRNVRSGVQAAMTLENDAEAIAAIVRMAAGAAPVDVVVATDCQCGAEAASCAAFCASGEPPSVYFAIRAERPHPGPFLEAAPLVAASRVKVR